MRKSHDDHGKVVHRLCSSSSISSISSIQKLIGTLLSSVRSANSSTRIKPTAPLSAIDKENSIEFLLDLLHYIYNYYHGYVSYFL